MSTTALGVEVLIIGFQVLIWIYLSTIVLLGHQWIDFSAIAFLKDWATVITLVLIGVSYILGIIFQSISTLLFTPISKAKWHKLFHTKLSAFGEFHIPQDNRSSRHDKTENSSEIKRFRIPTENSYHFLGIEPDEMWFYITFTHPEISKMLEKKLDNIKLLRATTLNFTIISILIFVLIFQALGFSWLRLFLFVVVVVLLMVLVYISWVKTVELYYAQLVGAMNILESEVDEEQAATIKKKEQ